MRRRLSAIILLTLRAAVRSRVVLALSGLLALALFGLPLLLTGDGSPDGAARLTLGYTLGAAFGLLALATLWASCALVSGDVQSQVLALTRVKPVSGFELWLGKWLGLLLLDLLLLTAALAVTGVQTVRRLGDDAPGATALRLSREVVAPVLPSLAEEAEARLAQLEPPPSAADRRAARRLLLRELPFAVVTLPQGESRDWTFRLSRPPGATQALWLRLRFDADRSTRERVQARCRLVAPGNGASAELTLDDFNTRELEIRLPDGRFAGQSEIVLSLRHLGTEGGALVVQPRQGMALLVARGTLAGNLLRAGLVLLALLALLAALGLTMGTLFSFPVAAFAATGLLVAALIGTYAASDPWDAQQHEADELEARGPLQRGLEAAAGGVVRALAAAARPSLETAPLGQLVASERISEATIGRVWLWNGVAMPLVCALLAAAALARRETE